MEKLFFTLDQYKTQARLLHKNMKDMGLSVTYMQAMQLVAKSSNFKSWEVLETHVLDQELIFKINSSSEITLDAEKSENIWIKVKNISVCVKAADEGVIVDLYNVDNEDEDSLAGTYLEYNEATSEEENCDKIHAERIKNSYLASDPDSYLNQEYAVDCLLAECNLFESRHEAMKFLIVEPNKKMKVIK
jgi:hypothetical protein